MPQAMELNGSIELFNLEADQPMKIIPTQLQYRRTAQYMKDLAQQDIVDMKLEKAIQDYYRDVTQLSEAIDDIRDSDMNAADKAIKVNELQTIMNKKENPAYDGDNLLNKIDQSIEALDLSVEFLHDVLDDRLTKKQKSIVDEANGTEIIEFSRNLARQILGIPDESEEDEAEKKDEELTVDEGLND